MAHGQDFFQKSLSKATFERKLSSVSLCHYLNNGTTGVLDRITTGSGTEAPENGTSYTETRRVATLHCG